MLESLQQSPVTTPDFVCDTSRFPPDKIGAWLSAVIQSSFDGVIVIDAANHMVLLNREAERMFGYRAEQLLGQTLDLLFPEKMRDEYRVQIAQFATAKVSGRRLRIKLDLPGVRSDGRELLISAAISRITVRGEVFLPIILRELPERTGESTPITLAQSALRQMALNSQQANEIEKRRFSREIYDDLGQRLSVLKLDLDWLENSSPADKNIPKRIAQMQRLLDNIITRTKNIASTLRPSLLDDFGLVPAVEWIADAFEKKTGIVCKLVNDGIANRPGDQLESAIFRVVQESLLNIERHADAGHVLIHLWHTEQHLHVLIQDDGIGLSEEHRNKPGCYGLIAMQERIYTLGGSLVVKNGDPRGLLIHASIPFHS